MTKIVLYIILISVAAAGPVWAQKPHTKTPETCSTLKWNTTSINLGKIQVGNKATDTFIFKNIGRIPVIVKQVCTDETDVEWTKEAVSAGRTGKIIVGYQSKKTGFFNKSIEVTTSDGEKTNLVVYGEVMTGPGAVEWKTTSIDLGKIPQGNSAVATFEFTNTSKKPLTIKNIQVTGPLSPWPQMDCIYPGQKGTVKLSYYTGYPGYFSNSAYVVFDNGEVALLRIKGEVTILPR